MLRTNGPRDKEMFAMTIQQRLHETTYVVHYSSPAFHRNALENGEHSEDDAVKADDAELGTLPAGRADGPPGRTDEPAAADAAAAAVAAAVRRTRRQLRLTGQVPLTWIHTVQRFCEGAGSCRFITLIALTKLTARRT